MIQPIVLVHAKLSCINVIAENENLFSDHIRIYTSGEEVSLACRYNKNENITTNIDLRIVSSKVADDHLLEEDKIEKKTSSCY